MRSFGIGAGVGIAALVGVAVAGVSGWTQGRPAKDAPRVLAGLPEAVSIDLPRSVARQIRGPTVLVYFSPTCPHCQQAQPELNPLAGRLSGTATVLGVGSGVASAEELATYAEDYSVPYPLIHDGDRAIASALRARSTPSVYLLDRDGRDIVVRELWTPYRAGSADLIELAARDDKWAIFHPNEYKGDAVCRACHTEEARSHALTHHAVAWPTLQRLDRDRDSDCVRCHVTGHGEDSGWTPGARHLTGVGCEACHGPGGPHDGERTDARASCEGCHDAEHSIAFSLEKGLPLIDHFSANELSDSDFRDALRRLYSGEKDHPLLAFADGPLRGSQACRSCHDDEHAWWAQDPHASAMATLADVTHQGEPAAAQVACVRCHASPVRSGGVASTSIEDFRVDEGGVGCESCHGPGGAHIDSEGAPGTIEGLGEECPVCVIEALCTSCHTAEWDPGWALEPRLQAIAHTPPSGGDSAD